MAASLPVVFVDTNVLLSATDTDRSSYNDATYLLATNQFRLVATPQVLREYLVVATRPVSANGLGLDLKDAISNIAEIRKRVTLLSEDKDITDILLGLLSRFDISGKRIHDVNIVACALVNNADAIVTDNVSDFNKFTQLIRILSLSEIKQTVF